MKEKAESSAACNHHRVGFLGLLVTLGIVFGDIGTSPLYVMKAILHTGESMASMMKSYCSMWNSSAVSA